MDSRPLERRNVSRKTPGDGMVEITRPVADQLRKVGTEFDVTTPDGDGRATLTSMPCTCRGAENPHEHWFLRSEIFRALTPGSDIELTLQDNRIVVTRS